MPSNVCGRFISHVFLSYYTIIAENGSRKSGLIELTRRLSSSSSYRSKYFAPKSTDVIPPRGTLMKLFHSQTPYRTSSNSIVSTRRNLGSDKFDALNRFSSTDERGSEHGGANMSNKYFEEKGIWKDNEMESSKSNIDTDSNLDDRQYRKSSMDAESTVTEDGKRYSYDSGDARGSRTSPKTSPCVSQLSSMHFHQYNDGSTSEKSDQQQQHVYVQRQGQEQLLHTQLTQSPTPTPIPSHSTTQVLQSDSSLEETVTPKLVPISLRTLPTRPPITSRNSSGNIDRDNKMFIGRQSMSVVDFFQKPKAIDPAKLSHVKRRGSRSKIQGRMLPTRSSFFADVSRYVSSSHDNAIRHDKHGRRNRSGSMDGMDEKSEDVLGVLNSRDFIGYVEMQY